jgi:hypothetical protein
MIGKNKNIVEEISKEEEEIVSKEEEENDVL